MEEASAVGEAWNLKYGGKVFVQGRLYTTASMQYKKWTDETM